MECGGNKLCIPDPAAPSQPKCICNFRCSTNQVDYVCGSNNQTYQTPCHLHKAACQTQTEISLQHQGVCALSPGLGGMSILPSTVLPSRHVAQFSCSMCSQHTFCNEERATCMCARCDHVTPAPVCGSDYRTYSSACHLFRDACLHKRSTTMAYAGPCKDPIHELPVPCRGVRCQYGAVCEPKDGMGVCVCPTFCPNYEDIVCGSDGRTYHNRCFLKRAECLEDTNISIAIDGPCPLPPTVQAATQASPAPPARKNADFATLCGHWLLF